MATVFTIIGLYFLIRGRSYWPFPIMTGLVFLGAGVFWSPVLRPLYVAWMRFAFALGWLNTRILLGIVFFFILTPLGTFLRLKGKDLLDEKIEKDRVSYWNRRQKREFDMKSYERLY
jgi:hypothetical protein